MKVDVYEYGGLGIIIDPESDTKVRNVILIGKQTVKCNPRQAVIYISSDKTDENTEKLDELKCYCANHNIVFVCPSDLPIASLEETYRYLFKNHLELNIKRDTLSICAASEKELEKAKAFQTFLLEEYDVETDEIVSMAKKL